MNLTFLSDIALVQTTENLVRKEREILLSVLDHLREINRRRLFSSLGYKSLFEFTVRRLGYPEDQAYRRIAAMKLIEEIPEIESKINTGDISLTHIGLAQMLFRQEKKIDREMSRETKLSVFEQIAKTSVREAERITLSLSSKPETAKPDRVNAISDSIVELKFTASNELMRKVESLKGLLAHKHPNISLGELFERLCELGLEEWDPAKTAAPRKRRVNRTPLRAQKTSQADIRHRVFKKANGQCESCGSTYALEVDHIEPRAHGGTSAENNLRLLCRTCNQRAAIIAFGVNQMQRYLGQKHL